MAAGHLTPASGAPFWDDSGLMMINKWSYMLREQSGRQVG